MTWADHRYARRHLERFVDDELTPVAVDRVALHLLDCPGCGAEVRFLLDVRGVLRRGRAGAFVEGSPTW